MNGVFLLGWNFNCGCFYGEDYRFVEIDIMMEVGGWLGYVLLLR